MELLGLSEVQGPLAYVVVRESLLASHAECVNNGNLALADCLVLQ